MDSALAIAKGRNGIVTASDLSVRGMQRRELASAVKQGALIRIGRGLYCVPDTWEDEYMIAQYRFSRGVFSHDTALYLLGFSDQAPEALTMSFPRGYNTTSVKGAGIIAKSSPVAAHDFEVTEVGTPYGNSVRTYDIERTICDMLRGTKNPDLQVINPALRAYLYSSRKNIPKLLHCGQRLGVQTKVQKYLEILL